MSFPARLVAGLNERPWKWGLALRAPKPNKIRGQGSEDRRTGFPLKDKTPTMAGLTQNSHPQTNTYHDAGFGRRMGWGSCPALLLIDVCAAY